MSSPCSSRTSPYTHRRPALRVRAEVARKADATEPGRLRAAGYFEKAIGVLSEIGAENELALAQAGYARLCRESGDSNTARQYYLTALETLERLGPLTSHRSPAGRWPT